jgi:hypothetical protein
LKKDVAVWITAVVTYIVPASRASKCSPVIDAYSKFQPAPLLGRTVHVSPPSVDFSTPAPWMLVLPFGSPLPAKTTFASSGLYLMMLTASVGSDCSPTDRQLAPRSVDFQIPPCAVPRRSVRGSCG